MSWRTRMQAERETAKARADLMFAPSAAHVGPMPADLPAPTMTYRTGNGPPRPPKRKKTDRSVNLDVLNARPDAIDLAWSLHGKAAEQVIDEALTKVDPEPEPDDKPKTRTPRFVVRAGAKAP